VLRIGRLAQFFSESVLVGFIFGLALVIAVKQIPKVLGIEGGGEEFFERCLVIIRQLPETDLPTAVVGVSSIGLMLLIERRLARVPAALVVLVAGIAASVVFGLEDRGVEVVGQIPAGLARPRLPDVGLGALLILVPGAMGIALVNFAEAIGPARGFASRHKYDIDANKELVALGAANVGAGLFQGFPIGSSLSKSAANDAAGARTPIALITASGLMVLVALFLTRLFEPLPEATLGAIVIVAVLGMMKVGDLRRFRQAPSDGSAAGARRAVRRAGLWRRTRHGHCGGDISPCPGLACQPRARHGAWSIADRVRLCIDGPPSRSPTVAGHAHPAPR
jgi:sulfate permease, SulP family